MCVQTDKKTELRMVILAPFSWVAFFGDGTGENSFLGLSLSHG